MKYLLDTQVLIWAAYDPARLSKTSIDILRDEEIIKYISTITIWEISIKEAIGKLNLNINWEQYIHYQSLEVADIKVAHILHTKTLPLIHRDPFDRLLISQAIIENIPLITADPEIAQYRFNYVKA